MKDKTIDQIDLSIIGDGRAKMFPIYENLPDFENFRLDGLSGKEEMPLLLLRNSILFPGMVLPITVSRDSSLKVLELAKDEKFIFGVVGQKNPNNNNPQSIDEIYEFGVCASIERIIPKPDGSVIAFVRGHDRFKVKSLVQIEPFHIAIVSIQKDRFPSDKVYGEYKVSMEFLRNKLLKLISLELNGHNSDLVSSWKSINNPVFFTSFIGERFVTNLDEKIQILAENNIYKRVLLSIRFIETAIELENIKSKIEEKTRIELDKQQRDYFLNQQIKHIQEELGNVSTTNDIVELREKAKNMKWSASVEETFAKEVQKLERLMPSSPEYSIQLQYCQTIISLPWDTYTEDNLSVSHAAEVLEQNHYGMKKVKERMLEYLAVLKLKGDLKSPIICLYGPPGVGKTSIGKSIADAMGREYVRISLGGVHDESEIRGHRRTYLGSMVGRIIQGIKKAKTSNPVFVLDEIDKISSDYKGDPASALLEVLDPEQNSTFHDNYLDIDYDLSKVLFIATANDVSRISTPLRDRMEMVEVSGYILDEKFHIAKEHLIPKIMQDHGVSLDKIYIDDEAIKTIIDDYTRESGVRALGRKLSELARKIAKKLAYDDAPEIVKVTKDDLVELLGRKIYYRTDYQDNEYAGVVTGLAWTSVGGEILFIESSLHKGSEFKLILTGNMGNVMKESASIAMDYVRAHIDDIGIDYEAIKGNELHIHIPEGAIPKDGPSAGITMVCSIVSAMTKRKVKSHIAMTGEMTLRGKVLPVGGIKEKILAAKRAGIYEIILSEENRRSIEEIDQIYLEDMQFHFVDSIDEVLKIAITDEIAVK